MDLIIRNASVLTMDPRAPRAQAAAVNGGRVAAVGTDADILALRTGNTKVIDAAGRTVLPGFHDSHLHLLGYAMMKRRADLRGLSSLEAVLGRLREHLAAFPPAPGEWLLAWGWDQTPYPEGRMPTRHDLDRVSPDLPIRAARKCGHVCALNTAALKAAGIFDDPPSSDGGVVELDGEGVPTGILKENAMDLAEPPQKTPDAPALRRLIALGAADFVRAGLTSVQSDDLSAYDGDPAVLFDAYTGLDAQGGLPRSVGEQMLLHDPDRLREVIAQGYVTGWGGGRFHIGPLKLLTDGSLGGRSARLRAPYADDPSNRGVALLPGERLRELALAAHRAGMQVAAHAIGDAAIAEVLDVFLEIQAAHPRPDPRHRVVHASLAAPDLLERFAQGGVAADVQPAFVPADRPFLESRLGAERAAHAYRFRDFLDLGIHIAGSSDCPVEDFRPLSGIHAAVNRADGPAQRLTLHEALALYTTGAAYNAREER
ncbi:MAG TPA: amidohydrolase, partial [Candidatus Limnocylindria bacterium]|nr:amidohydrolase [Candidatus Limnocylindria bacterium]